MNNKTKTMFLSLQALALAAGNYVGWITIFKEIGVYCGTQDGGLWALISFSGDNATNPLLSACFWGSLVFLIALIWTARLFFEKNVQKFKLQMRRLWWLLLAGSLFALANNIPLFYKFYTQSSGNVGACSADTVTNPYLTSCFLGFAAFLLATVFASAVRRSK